ARRPRWPLRRGTSRFGGPDEVRCPPAGRDLDALGDDPEVGQGVEVDEHAVAVGAVAVALDPLVVEAAASVDLDELDLRARVDGEGDLDAVVGGPAAVGEVAHVVGGEVEADPGAEPERAAVALERLAEVGDDDADLEEPAARQQLQHGFSLLSATSFEFGADDPGALDDGGQLP